MGIKTATPPAVPVPLTGRLGSLLRVPVDYILEVYTGARLVGAVTLPQAPSEFEARREAATVLTHTLGDVVRELTENHKSDLRLKGVSGVAPRLGNTRDGGVSFITGREILEEFDKFLNEYQLSAQADAGDTYMVFRALPERLAFRVEPLRWEWSLNSQDARFSYKWSLELEAYGGAPSSPRVDVLSPVTDALRAAQGYVNAAAGAVALVGAAATNLGGELSEVTNTLRSVGRVADALSYSVQAADGLRVFVTESLPATFYATCDKFARAWDQAVELSDNLGITQPEAQAAATTLQYNALTTAGLLGVTPDLAQSALGDESLERDTQGASVNTNAPRAQVTYTWRAGDTLQGVALRAYGDAARWGEIASANGLRSGRWADGTPLRVGDVLQVPRDQVLETRGAARSREPFGVDIRVNLATGDLVLEDGDLARSRGAANLEQALALRLLTEQGESWILPSYGLPVRVGASGSPRESAYLAAQVQDQLKQDARVREITSVDVLSEGDGIAVSVALVPIAGTLSTFTTPYMRG
jgi:nucleoid-associated protein YgaU